MEQNNENEQVVQMIKPINWIIPDFIRSEHATHLVVQQQGSEFILLFFELQAPLFAGTPEEQYEAFKELNSTDAKCVAKIILSADNTMLAANNLIDSLNKFGSLLQTLRGQEDANTVSPSQTTTS